MPTPTRNIVPRENGGGSLGTEAKNWGAMRALLGVFKKLTAPEPTEDTDAATKAYVDKVVADAKTAAIRAAALSAHPVGSYLYTDKADNPNTYMEGLEGTTWELLGGGRVLMSAGTYTDSNGTVTYKAGETGGERLHQLTVGEMPSHGHLVRTWNVVKSGAPKLYRNGHWEAYNGGSYAINGGSYVSTARTDAPQNGQGDPAGTTDGTGSNGAHNNLQPYSVVYVFRRKT